MRVYRAGWAPSLVACMALLLAGCSSDNATSGAGNGSSSSGGETSRGSTNAPPTKPEEGPKAGNSNGNCEVPAEAQAESIANPRPVVGTGTPESCTGDAFVAAVAKGGVITFQCGDAPATITLSATAKSVSNPKPPLANNAGGT